MAVDDRPDDQVPDAHGGAEEDGDGVEAELRPVAAPAGHRRERQERPGGAGIEGEVADIGQRRERAPVQHDLEHAPDEVAEPPAAEGDRHPPPGPPDARVDARPGRHPPGGDHGRQPEDHGADVAHDLLGVIAESGVGRADQEPGREHHEQHRAREVAHHNWLNGTL